MSGTIATLTERALIARIADRVGPLPAGIILGIGDDAALVAPRRGELVVLTSDSLVEDVHFRRASTPARRVGHKALAVNLSDLAAMGATPTACLLNLALPSDLPIADFDAMADGFAGLAGRTTPLVGGNITRSPGPLVIDVTVVGSVHPRRVLRRSGGRPGDDLYVTGCLGGAAAGLRLLERAPGRSGLTGGEAAALARLEEPIPRLRTGRAVARQAGARAAIDLSDGLAAAVAQLAEASGTGASIDAAAVPVDPAVGACGFGDSQATDMAVGGGEDYELLFAVPPRRRRAFEAAVRRAGETSCTLIGRLTTERSLELLADGRRRDWPATGFAHF